jgi:hypothetical protein
MASIMCNRSAIQWNFQFGKRSKRKAVSLNDNMQHVTAE